MSEGMNNSNSKGNFDKYPLALPEGTAVGGKYIIKSVLGQGGFGITYLAQDYKTNELVAIKEYFPDTLATRTNASTVSVLTGDREQNFTYGKDCFLQEARTLSEFIGNPNIVRIISYFEENNTAYFVMEYVEGESLKTHLDNNGGKLSWEETKRFLFPVIDALSSVHAKGIIHRDISPDNIIITDSGNIKLIDFGAARYSLGDKSRSLDVVLKHGYAPKEQYTRHGKQGPFTDVYSLGATFYRTLTGRIPPDSIDRLEEDDLVLPSTLGSDISEDAEEAIVKALSVQPAERYQNMAEFKKALPAEENDEIVKTVAVFNEDKNRETVTVLMTDTKADSENEHVAEIEQELQPTQPQSHDNKKDKKKKSTIILVFLSLIVPFLGIIMLFVNKKKNPNAAKSYFITVIIRLLILIFGSFLIIRSSGIGKKGSVEGLSYENKYYDLGYTLPEDYEFISDEELVFQNKAIQNYDGVIQYEYNPEKDIPSALRYYAVYIDGETRVSCAVSRDKKTVVNTYVIPKIYYTKYDDDWLFDYSPIVHSVYTSSNNLMNHLVGVVSYDKDENRPIISDVSDYNTSMEGKNEMLSCTVNYYDSETNICKSSHSFYVTEKNNIFMVTAVSDYSGEKNSSEKKLNFYTIDN